MDLRTALMQVRTERGVLTPRTVLESARPVDSPLHHRFEWDDARAGEKYRLQQAHELIRVVRVKLPSDDPVEQREVRAFQAVRTEGDDASRYVYEPAEEVAYDPLLRAIVLRDMERAWRELRLRYETFAEFVEMVRRDLDAA